MMRSRVSILVLVTLSLALAAWSGETGIVEIVEDEPMQMEHIQPQARWMRSPPAGANGVRPSCFWAHGAQRALRALGGAALDAGGGALPAVPVTEVPASCREVLDSAVACALPEGESLEDSVTGDTYAGWWGLAPEWRDGALGVEGRRWVTGCLLQRLNVSGASVPILLEGPHPAIAEDAALEGDYPIVESTAFGDLFSSGTPLLGLLPAFNAFVCWEGLLPQSNGLLGLPLLGQRICDDAPLCGMVPIGPCSLVCAPNGPYRKCKPHLLSPWWTQTVRVRLETESGQ